MPLFETIEQEEIKSNNIFDEYNYDSFVEENNKKLDAQKQEHNLWVQNIVSPEKIAEWQKMGTMSALEVFNRKEKNELVPYMGTIEQANKGIRIKNISDAMRKGLYVSPEDKQFYEQFVLDMAEIQTRGYTFGGKAVNAGLETLPFVVEFGAGLLTTGGASSLGASAAKFGVKGAIKKATSEAVEAASKKIAEDGVLKAAGKGIGKVAYDATFNLKTHAFTVTRLPQQVKARYADIMLSDSLAITEEGQAILLEAKEKPATAFLKALGMTNIEVASEMAGATLLKPTGAALNRFIAPKIMSKLPEKFATRFTKVAEEITGMPFVKGVEALGFNGLVEEMGEERVGDILRYAFDLDEQQGYTFEQFLDAAFPSAEQLAVEAVTFGAMGVGMGLTDAGLKKVSKKYSKDEFLIDSGIMHGAGELESIIDKKVRAVLKFQGKSEEEIEQTIQFGTREQKVDYLRENKNIITEAETSEIAEVVADRYRASGRNLDEARIEKISKLFAGILVVQAEKEGKAVEEMLDLLPSVEQVGNYMYVSDDGVGYSSEEISEVYGRALEFYNSIEETEETKEQRLKLEKDIRVLEDMANGKLKDEDAALAYNILGKNINKTIGGYKYNQEEGIQAAASAGADENEVAEAEKEWKEKGTESKYFKKYTDNAPLVGSEEALNYEFKTGKKVAVNGFHGTQRGDRVGEIFRPDRATSGPMAFFSSDRQISENYAKSKQDTSLSDDMGDYDQWFKLKIGGNSLTLKDAWWNLTSKQRQEIAEKAPHITLDWDADEIIYDENTNRGLGNYDYEIKRYRGNALKTLVESWLTSGTLYDREDDFLKVLDLVGIKREDIDYIDPYTDHSKVYDVFIAFKKPLVTTDIPEKVIKKLEKEAPKHPAKYNSYGDPWDKNTQDGVEWITTLKEDIAKNENSYVWTSIPDWVTDILKGFGYDGVIDMGGKSGGEIHKVYIPFYSEQIKSVDNRGTFDANNPNIYYQGAESNEIIKPVQLEKDAVPNFEKVSELKEWIAKELNLLGEITIKNNNRATTFNRGNIGRSMKGVNRSSVKRNSYAGLKELVEGSLYSYDKVVDERHKRKNNGQEIYHNAFIYDGKIYGIEISVDIPKNENQKYSYAGHKIKEIGSAINVLSQNEISDRTEPNISINDIRNLFKPDVKLYQEGEQYSLFEGNNVAKKIHRVKGGFLPAENFIELFENADESTIIHETGHWFLNTLVARAEYSEEIAQDLEEVRKYLKNTGEPFTREQHEKFARGFEAYILNGNARSNRLKKIFEDFKNWLFAIYDNIKDVGYKIEDMPEVEKLFNRLFSSERERVQKTVFDKCNAIDEQIKSIKENQEKELDELDTIWRENQEVLNRKQDKKREIDEYLALAKTAAKKEPKELKEYKERYKEATLEILEAATGFDRKFIANKKNWEKVENAINDTADKINVSGGFQKHWAEFYTDEGVDYETDDVTGGFELASEAFNVLKEGKYSFDNTQDSDIQEFAGQFDYIYGKILSLKGEEKETALNALYALIGDMPSLPDEYVANILEKVSEIEAEYEEQQKEDFNRKRYPNVPVVQQLQWFVTNKLRELKVYNPETKYRLRINKSHRLYSYIKNAVSVNSAKKVVRKINSYVIEDLRNQQRGLLHKEIQKQIKVNSKVLKTGGVKKGKFDWRTNTVFAELKEMNRLSKQEALEKYEQLIKLDEIQKQQSRDGWDENAVEFNDFKNEFDENLKRNFLEYKASVGRGGNIKDLNVEMGRTVLTKIMELKQKGREAKDKRDYDEKVNMRSFRNSYVDDIKKYSKNPKQRKLVQHLLYSGETLANWETTINAILGSQNADDLSLLLDEARVETYQRDITLKLYQKIAKIYNLKKANWFDKALDWDNAQAVIDLFQNFEKEVFTMIEKTFSINTGDFVENNVEITKGELITLYGWAQNDNLKQRLYTQYGMPQLEEMFEKHLTDKDKDLAFALIDTLEEMYADINDVFIETTGFSLPHEQNYLPSVPERVVSPLDMMQDFVQASRTPSGVKARKICNRIKMKPVSPMQIVLPHINKMSRYVIMQEKLAFYRQVFADLNILATLKECYGKKDGEALYRLILTQLDGVSFSGTNRINGKLKEFADNMSKNYIVGNIAGSLKVALGQLTSMINYSENMPIAEWSAGFAKSIANPVETFKFMIDNCPYLQARLAGNTQNEIVASLTNEKDRFRKLTNFFTSNVKWGDIIAITLGGRPYVEYLMKQGMSKEEAFDKFVLETLRAQQAGTASSTSQWQKHQSNNAIGRMFWAFRNTEFQYERKVFDALLKASRGEMTKAQAAKTVLIYRVINPILFQCMLQQVAIAPLLRMLFGEDDDPEQTLKDLGVSGLVALVTANLSHWGFAGIIAGGITQTAIKGITKSKDMKIFESQVPVLSEVESVYKKFTKKSGADFLDYVDAVACIAKYGWGIPAPKLVNAGEGVYNITQGDVGVGLLRIAGWGEYTSTEAITGEAPKKKKKKKK